MNDEIKIDEEEMRTLYEIAWDIVKYKNDLTPYEYVGEILRTLRIEHTGNSPSELIDAINKQPKVEREMIKRAMKVYILKQDYDFVMPAERTFYQKAKDFFKKGDRVKRITEKRVVKEKEKIFQELNRRLKANPNIRLNEFLGQVLSVMGIEHKENDTFGIKNRIREQHEGVREIFVMAMKIHKESTTRILTDIADGKLENFKKFPDRMNFAQRYNMTRGLMKYTQKNENDYPKRNQPQRKKTIQNEEDYNR